MMTNLRRPQPLPADRSTFFLRFVVLVGLGGLVCFGLARYISAQIVRLREATRKLAAGELNTRLGANAARGRDEIAQLSRDFDLMADRLEQLILSEKTLTRDISHELRSPLARLGVALELAKSKSDATLTPSLARIETEAARLNDMISRLLFLSKLETGIVGYDETAFNLTAALQQIADDADFEAKAAGKAVRLGETPTLSINGNEGLIRSALENVIRNAVRYTTTVHPVEVTMETENDFVVVTVEDGGGGVPQSELDKLFRPFYRVGEARERRAGGVGLGLAIAERAIHAHDGSITALNSSNGLRVTIKLPLHGARQRTT
jgi:two-component system sensor histidine kinase CpxA